MTDKLRAEPTGKDCAAFDEWYSQKYPWVWNAKAGLPQDGNHYMTLKATWRAAHAAQEQRVKELEGEVAAKDTWVEGSLNDSLAVAQANTSLAIRCTRLEAMVKVLREGLEDMWDQFAYESNGRKSSGGLSALENAEYALTEAARIESEGM